MNPEAILFDFDGVLVDSIDIKTRAFADLFAKEADHLPAIVALHLRHGGLSRKRKLRMIHRDILRRPLTGADENQLAEQFATLVKEKVIAAPALPGVEEFLETWHAKRALFIVSGTPEEELTAIVSARGWERYFSKVHGSPRLKEEIINNILTHHALSAQNAVFIGDAMTDYDAAIATGLAFIGVKRKGEVSPFPVGTIEIEDLTRLENVLRSLPGEGPRRWETESMRESL